MDASALRATGIGTALQVLMVVLGHFSPGAREAGLFPIAGTVIGLVTGWLSGGGTRPASSGNAAIGGGLAGGIAGALGSLVSTALGDVPFGNIAIAGGSTFVTGALAALVRARKGQR